MIPAPIKICLISGKFFSFQNSKSQCGKRDSKVSRVKVVVRRNRSRAGQDAGSGFAFEAGIDGIAEPPVDGTFLEAAGF